MTHCALRSVDVHDLHYLLLFLSIVHRLTSSAGHLSGVTEGISGVTTFAVAAKAARVHVICPVAAVTIALSFYFFRCFGMAGGACQPGMFTFKGKIRLRVVIKLPQCPIVWCVAGGTIGT